MIQFRICIVDLTKCGLVMPYGNIDIHNSSSGNGLLSDGTKPLTEPMLNNHQWSLLASILDMSLNLTNLRLWLHLPGEKGEMLLTFI